MTTRKYPEPRRFISADEARAQGLGLFRGIVVATGWSLLFWGLAVVLPLWLHYKVGVGR